MLLKVKKELLTSRTITKKKERKILFVKIKLTKKAVYIKCILLLINRLRQMYGCQNNWDTSFPSPE